MRRSNEEMVGGITALPYSSQHNVDELFADFVSGNVADFSCFMPTVELSSRSSQSSTARHQLPVIVGVFFFWASNTRSL